MQNSSQLEIRICPTSYSEIMPGTPLEVRYPTRELGADRSTPTSAGCFIWCHSNLKTLDVMFIKLCLHLSFSSAVFKTKGSVLLLFFFCLWLTGTHWSWDISSRMFPLRPCLERGFEHDMLSNGIIFYWFQLYFILALFKLVRWSISTKIVSCQK